MSNTTTVTPYEPETSVADTAVAAGSAMAEALRWVCQETSEDRAILEAAREADRRLLAPARVPLRIASTEGLASCAASLGYAVERRRDAVFLRHADGTRLALAPDDRGRIVAHGNRGRLAVQRLVKAHTEARLAEHLRRIGMVPDAAPSRAGEVSARVLREPANPARKDGAAKLTVDVRPDGRVVVDVDCVKGGRCMDLVKGIADAVGARVEASRLKPSFRENVAEAPRKRVGG